MIEIDDKIVSFDLITERFACDVSKCKGCCCVAGDSGAPLEPGERATIAAVLPLIYDKLSAAGRRVIAERGFCEIDCEGDLTTTFVPDTGACVFANVDEQGIAYCVFQRCFDSGLITFRKPMSCFLYPVRIRKYRSFEAVNYHCWDICKAAVDNGRRNDIRVYRFLQEPLTQKFGQSWYDELCKAAAAFIAETECKP